MMPQTACAIADPCEALELFINKTCLLPVIVFDQVVREIIDDGDGDLNDKSALFDYVMASNLLGFVENRSATCYGGHTQFRRLMHAPDPRDNYKMFMKHWVTAELKRRQQEIARHRSTWKMPALAE
jgi:hypothetical protein